MHADYERLWGLLAEGLAEHVACKHEEHEAIVAALRRCPLVPEAQVLQALAQEDA